MRSLLAAVALALLVCQAAAAAAPPVMACVSASPDGGQEIVCTCVHAPGAECPMHKTAKKPHRTPPASRETRCCANTTPGQATEMTVLIGFVGLPEEKHIPGASTHTSDAPPPRAFLTLELSSPPSSPPPEV